MSSSSSTSDRWLFDRIAARLGAPRFLFTGPERLRPFERVVSSRLDLDRFPPLGVDPTVEDLAQVVDQEAARDFARFPWGVRGTRLR
jgi:hypothetical protein